MLIATDEDPDHARCIACLSLAIFDGLERVHGLGAEHRELLEAGALLANVGLMISHSAHHKHSYYIAPQHRPFVRADREIEMVAQLARFHRKARPDEQRHPEFGALSLVDRAVVRTLAGILRVAVGLDRSHANKVGDASRCWSRPTRCRWWQAPLKRAAISTWSSTPVRPIPTCWPRCSAGASASPAQERHRPGTVSELTEPDRSDGGLERLGLGCVEKRSADEPSPLARLAAISSSATIASSLVGSDVGVGGRPFLPVIVGRTTTKNTAAAMARKLMT